MTTLVEFIEVRLTEDEQVATNAARPHLASKHWNTDPWFDGTGERCDLRAGTLGQLTTHGGCLEVPAGEHAARHDPVRVLREVEAKRRILAEHKPRLQMVEWPHDQTGDGHGWTCPRCQNAENDASDWHPPVGGAGEFPKDEFVTPYVLAPCLTLTVLASVWSDHPDYRSEWAPETARPPE